MKFRNDENEGPTGRRLNKPVRGIQIPSLEDGVSYAEKRNYDTAPSPEHVWCEELNKWVIPKPGSPLDLARRKEQAAKAAANHPANRIPHFMDEL